MSTQSAVHPAESLDALRAEFPILGVSARGNRLVYLDNAATTQKPQSVIDAVTRYYSGENGNIHRGVHYLSELATERFEGTREATRAFLNAESTREIVFTRGTTESINLVASSFGHAFVRQGDEIIISALEHHSNIVPWQMLCERSGASMRVIPVDDTGVLDLAAFRDLLNERVRIVAVSHASNALGTINPVREIVAEAHTRGIPVLVDGAQAAAHFPIDVRALDCDFYVCSGHKMYGPTGVGVLYGKESWLERMPPYMGGGDMIAKVTFERSTYADLPAKFEAGTPDIAGVVGFAASLAFVQRVQQLGASEHENELCAAASEQLAAIPGVRLIGTAPHKVAVVSFVMACAHPHDIATVLDAGGVAVRAGHHCAQPLMARLQVQSTARASFACYNTMDDVGALIRGVQYVREVFE